MGCCLRESWSSTGSDQPFLTVRIGYCSELSRRRRLRAPTDPTRRRSFDHHGQNTSPSATGNPPGLSSHFNPIFPLVPTVTFPPATKLV